MKNSIFSTLAFVLLISSSTFASEYKKVEELLEISFEELMNIMVYAAGKQAQKTSDIPANIEIITRKDIERYEYMDLTEILKNIVGMYP